MDSIKKFLDYFSPGEWQIIGIAGTILFWLLNKLTNWYFARKVRRIQKAGQERSRTDDSNH
ncbi:hypothetical protein JNO12_14870 [Erwinia aphidicola]|nr:hypothetical protein [Erwinia aphidicola]